MMLIQTFSLTFKGTIMVLIVFEIQNHLLFILVSNIYMYITKY